MDDRDVIYDEGGVYISKELSEKLSEFSEEFMKRVLAGDLEVSEILQKAIDEAMQTITKIVELTTKLVEIFKEDIVPPVVDDFCEYYKELSVDFDEEYRDKFPRIYHLARFAPKERTRKKNRARLFEMIKALYRPGLCS